MDGVRFWSNGVLAISLPGLIAPDDAVFLLAAPYHANPFQVTDHPAAL